MNLKHFIFALIPLIFLSCNNDDIFMEEVGHDNILSTERSEAYLDTLYFGYNYDSCFQITLSLDYNGDISITKEKVPTSSQEHQYLEGMLNFGAFQKDLFQYSDHDSVFILNSGNQFDNALFLGTVGNRDWIWYCVCNSGLENHDCVKRNYLNHYYCEGNICNGCSVVIEHQSSLYNSINGILYIKRN